MTEAAAAPAAPAESAPAQDGRPPIPEENRGAPGTTLNRVKALRDQLAAKREARVVRNGPKDDAPAGDAKPAAKAEAKPEPAKDGKPAAEKREAKPDEKPTKAEAKDKAEPAKDGRERDEHGRFVGTDGPKETPKPKDVPADSDPPPAAAKSEQEPADKPKAEAKPEQAPEKKPEPSKGAEARLARTLLELRDAKAEAMELGKKAKRADELENLLKRAKGAELDDDVFEQLTGRTFETLVKSLAKNEIKYKPKSPMAPEVRSLQERLDRMEAERTAEREAREQSERKVQGEAARGKELGMVKTWLDEAGDKFPYLTGMEDAHEQVLDAFYGSWPRDAKGRFIANQRPDVEEVAEQIEGYLSKRFGSAAANKRAMLTMLKDPKAKALAIEILGLQKPADTETRETPSPQRDTKGNQQSAPAEGPRTLSNKVTQDVPALVQRTQDEEEERTALHSRWRAAMRAQGR